MFRWLTHAALLGSAAPAFAAAASVAAPAIGGPDIVVIAPVAAFAAPRLPDAEMAEMRGGFSLPNGFDVAIGIDIQTRVDGVLVLHTLYASDGPIVGTRLFTDGKDGERLAPGTATVTTVSTPTGLLVATGRNPSGTQIAVTPSTSAATVNFVDGAQSTWVTAEGQTPVPVEPNGASVTTGPGTFSLKQTDGGTIATLDTGDLRISHLVGQATGAVIANTANDRIIDTVSSVNIDLMNAPAALPGGFFANDALALDLVRGR